MGKKHESSLRTEGDGAARGGEREGDVLSEREAETHAKASTTEKRRKRVSNEGMWPRNKQMREHNSLK